APLLTVFVFASRRRHTSSTRDWSSDVCSSDLGLQAVAPSPASLVHGGARRLDLPEQRLLARELAAALSQLSGEPRQRFGIGRDQLALLGQQLLPAVLQRLQRLVRMSEVRLLDLEGLLGLGDALALARDPTL